MRRRPKYDEFDAFFLVLGALGAVVLGVTIARLL